MTKNTRLPKYDFGKSIGSTENQYFVFPENILFSEINFWKFATEFFVMYSKKSLKSLFFIYIYVNNYNMHT